MNRNLNAATGQSFSDALAAEVAGQSTSFDSPDVKEGIRAFRDKREPNLTA